MYYFCTYSSCLWPGVSEDELFGQFFGALERIHYFKPTSDGHDDQVQLDRATQLFQNAVMVWWCAYGYTFLCNQWCLWLLQFNENTTVNVNDLHHRHQMCSELHSILYASCPFWSHVSMLFKYKRQKTNKGKGNSCTQNKTNHLLGCLADSFK